MKPLMIIAGAGQTGRELARRMAPNWELVVIDPLPEKLARLKVETPDAEAVEGDATSALVLRGVGAQRARAAVALTGRDEVNLEFCRLLGELFNIPDRFATVTNRALIERFTELGAQVVSRAFSVASVLQTRMQPGRRTTSEIGLGLGELFEVTVLAHSPVIGRPLSSLHATTWLVGAIYRQGNLVVPHGGTVVQEGDRVLLVGEPEVLPSVADYFRRGSSEFPLQYGSSVVVVDPEARQEGYSVTEGLYLVRETDAQGLKVLAAPYQDRKTLAELCRLAGVEAYIDTRPEDWPGQVVQMLSGQGCGCLALPAPSPGFLDWLGIGHGALFELLDHCYQPCLLCRGTFPYRRILLAAAPGQGSARAAELAMDVARKFGAHLTAMAVLPPEFVSGSEHNQELRAAVERAAEVGAYYSLDVEARVVEGNPVRRLADEAASYDLLVMGHQKGGSHTLTSPDISRHLLLRAPCSVMVLPHER